jgi:phage gpG-like protein
MARARVSIRGRRGLKRALRTYQAEVRTQIAFEMTAVMEEIQDTARRIVPVDTGQLQGSIQPEPRVVDADDLTGYVGTNVEYAGVIEFGITETVQVSAHTRRMEQGFGPDSAYPMQVTVPAHTRRMDRSGNFYLTKAAQAAAQTYNKRMADAIQRASP